MADLKFKYGTNDINGAGNDPGTIYIQKTGDKKAKMYIDTPTETSTRLQIGGIGDVYIGDPADEEAKDYQVTIDPNGTVLDGLVTGQDIDNNPTEYIIRVVEKSASELDTYIPTDVNRNIITFVVQK